MAHDRIKIIYGGFFAKYRGDSLNKVEEVLQYLASETVQTIDTAEIYCESEEFLGIAGAAKDFAIDTKFSGGLLFEQEVTEANIIKSCDNSLKRLNTDSVDVFYLHIPCRNHPMKPILAGVNKLYADGKFKRFGLSNFNANEVEEVVQVAKVNNFVMPSVYQGNYNALARRTETELMPVLRKYNIAFYAYSPIAGGFLAKTPERLLFAGSQGRWDPSNKTYTANMYNALYNKPCMLKALEDFIELSMEAKIPQAELAYRWVAHNSQLRSELGDGIIIGARLGPQLEEALSGIRKGPLPIEVAKKIDALWEGVKDESPLDNFEGYIFSTTTQSTEVH